MKPKPQQKANNRATQGHWHEMNRKQRREMMRKMQSEDLSLEILWSNFGAGQGWPRTRKRNRSNDLDWICVSFVARRSIQLS